jgi:hypothetical protein
MPGSVSPGSASQKPIESEIINTNFLAPPPTLADMVARAQLVVRGRAFNATPRSTNAGEILTDYKIKVEEVIRDAGNVLTSDELTFIRQGGDLDVGSTIRRAIQSGFPPLELSHEYVLFLYWNDARPGWVSAFGPDSVVDLSSGEVVSPGKAPVTSALRGSSANAYLKNLRRAARAAR